ncbi:MAG TPA: hypothetical protein VFL66_12835 [Gaiellaceae bacterium]|nr:hypothetical protein [Gaiellaceae bacterium]
MLVAVWVTLGFLVLVLVGGTAHVVREGLAAWRAIRRTGRALGACAEALGSRAERVSRKAAGAGSADGRLAGATARLSRSLAYARVVADAAGDAGATLVRLRGSVPRK